MGLSSKKTKSSTKPVYSKEVEGAAKSVSNTYNSNIGNVQDISGQISGLVPEMIAKYREGDAGVNAARDYNVDVLNGDYLNNNPYVDDLVQQGNNDVMNRQQAILGKRGVGGTSNFTELVGGAINRNSLGTRADIYDRERSRMDGAAGRAPGIAAADAIQIAPLMSAAGASLLPMQAASGYGATIGGLLGPYTNSEQKSSGGFLPGLIGTALGGWASGGFNT